MVASNKHGSASKPIANEGGKNDESVERNDANVDAPKSGGGGNDDGRDDRIGDAATNETARPGPAITGGGAATRIQGDVRSSSSQPTIGSVAASAPFVFQPDPEEYRRTWSEVADHDEAACRSNAVGRDYGVRAERAGALWEAVLRVSSDGAPSSDASRRVVLGLFDSELEALRRATAAAVVTHRSRRRTSATTTTTTTTRPSSVVVSSAKKTTTTTTDRPPSASSSSRRRSPKVSSILDELNNSRDDVDDDHESDNESPTTTPTSTPVGTGAANATTTATSHKRPPPTSTDSLVAAAAKRTRHATKTDLASKALASPSVAAPSSVSTAAAAIAAALGSTFTESAEPTANAAAAINAVAPAVSLSNTSVAVARTTSHGTTASTSSSNHPNNNNSGGSSNSNNDLPPVLAGDTFDSTLLVPLDRNVRPSRRTKKYVELVEAADAAGGSDNDNGERPPLVCFRGNLDAGRALEIDRKKVGRACQSYGAPFEIRLGRYRLRYRRAHAPQACYEYGKHEEDYAGSAAAENETHEERWERWRRTFEEERRTAAAEAEAAAAAEADNGDASSASQKGKKKGKTTTTTTGTTTTSGGGVVKRKVGDVAGPGDATPSTNTKDAAPSSSSTTTTNNTTNTSGGVYDSGVVTSPRHYSPEEIPVSALKGATTMNPATPVSLARPSVREDDHLCLVCQTQRARVVLLPCHHCVLCSRCSAAGHCAVFCPSCRTRIETRLHCRYATAVRPRIYSAYAFLSPS